MKRLVLAVSMTLAVALGVCGVASAADPGASCQALVSSSFAGEPGARPADGLDAFAEAAERGVPVGVVLSEFSRSHLGSPEGCWGG